MKLYTAEYFIKNLDLEGHVEGGYYKETYRNPFPFKDERGERALSTTIYYLLESGQVSKLHKLNSDEMWFYQYGSPMVIHTIDENGIYKALHLGLDFEKGQNPQILVPANVVFGAEPLNEDSFSLVSCMVSPGFDYRDFTLYGAEELCNMFPHCKDLIIRINGR
ncbi:cupin domain-containing protein [Alkaliphilus serpentinus]|uniref:Cupin domain-containing protein n=1 Tax=Alkaliphilus serpentinus TaxID=1482731 RepID=A0A833M5Z7_9FIRM|nr:cupin domain-containing protein [Alkaliphilus serpentinus]KAB3525744.1 cupin domain-containing protein [Alkaliphilus serpentinus]